MTNIELDIQLDVIRLGDIEFKEFFTMPSGRGYGDLHQRLCELTSSWTCVLNVSTGMVNNFKDDCEVIPLDVEIKATRKKELSIAEASWRAKEIKVEHVTEEDQ